MFSRRNTLQNQQLHRAPLKIYYGSIELIIIHSDGIIIKFDANVKRNEILFSKLFQGVFFLFKVSIQTTGPLNSLKYYGYYVNTCRLKITAVFREDRHRLPKKIQPEIAMRILIKTIIKTREIKTDEMT